VLVPSQHAWPLEPRELEPALELVTDLGHADMGILMLYDEQAEMLRPVLTHGMSDAQSALFGSHQAGSGPFAVAKAEHRRVRVRNAWDGEEVLRDAARRLGFRAAEILPVFRRDGGFLGALVMIYRSRHATRRRAAKLQAHCADVLACALTEACRRFDAEGARDRLARSSGAKIQFFARMSHELRTPLQSISGYVDLLRADTTEPLTVAQTRMLSRIAENERILVHIIDDLITFSRLEAGHVTYNIGPVAAQEALRVTEDVVSPLAMERGVHLDVKRCPPGLLVTADSDKLKQILVNLAANALKFTASGGTVGLSCRYDAESVLFDVSDTGTGIARDKLRDIFEPYMQLDSPIVDQLGGFGLGLAISREFASGMAGTLSVTSDVGHGSVFTLRLPRSHETVDSTTPTIAAKSSAHATRRQTRRSAPSL
jgi:signal transduction histidine kinase